MKQAYLVGFLIEASGGRLVLERLGIYSENAGSLTLPFTEKAVDLGTGFGPTFEDAIRSLVEHIRYRAMIHGGPHARLLVLLLQSSGPDLRDLGIELSIP